MGSGRNQLLCPGLTQETRRVGQRAGRVDLVINTPSGRGARSDGAAIRVAAIRAGIPCLTTIEAAAAAARAIRAEAEDALAPLALQDLGASVGARIIGAGAGG